MVAITSSITAISSVVASRNNIVENANIQLPETVHTIPDLPAETIIENYLQEQIDAGNIVLEEGYSMTDWKFYQTDGDAEIRFIIISTNEEGNMSLTLAMPPEGSLDIPPELALLMEDKFLDSTGLASLQNSVLNSHLPEGVSLDDVDSDTIRSIWDVGLTEDAELDTLPDLLERVGIVMDPNGNWSFEPDFDFLSIMPTWSSDRLTLLALADQAERNGDTESATAIRSLVNTIDVFQNAANHPQELQGFGEVLGDVFQYYESSLSEINPKDAILLRSLLSTSGFTFRIQSGVYNLQPDSFLMNDMDQQLYQAQDD